MSVLQRGELEDSPLADLHAIASELGIEGYRTLRRDDLIAAILTAQGGGEAGPDAEVGEQVDVDVEQRDEAAEPQPVEPEPREALDADVELEAAAEQPAEGERPEAVVEPAREAEPEPEPDAEDRKSVV